MNKDDKGDDMQEAVRGDVLTTARYKKGDVNIEESEPGRGGISYRVTQTPLDHYLKRRIISRAEFRAGDRMARDFILSGQTPGMTASLSDIRGGQGGGFTTMQLEARQRWRLAMDSINGKIGQLMVLNVCCYGYWLKDGVDSEENRKRKVINYLHYKTSAEAIARFHEALQDLIDYYELTRNSH